MTTTAQQIITAALGRDAAIDTTILTVQQAEVIASVGRILRKEMSLAMPSNPAYFGIIKNVAATALGGIAGWARPSDAYAIYRVEAAADTKDEAAAVIANGTEIKIAPFDDRGLFAGEPSLYEFGQFFVRAGNAGDPSTGSINFFYAAKVITPVAVTDILDARFPDDMADLIVAGLNAWFCKRDGRDTKTYDDVVAEWRELFSMMMANSTLTLAQRFESFRSPRTTASGAE